MADYKESRHKNGQQRKTFNVVRSQKERKMTHPNEFELKVIIHGKKEYTIYY